LEAIKPTSTSSNKEAHTINDDELSGSNKRKNKFQNLVLSKKKANNQSSEDSSKEKQTIKPVSSLPQLKVDFSADSRVEPNPKIDKIQPASQVLIDLFNKITEKTLLIAGSIRSNSCKINISDTILGSLKLSIFAQDRRVFITLIAQSDQTVETINGNLNLLYEKLDSKSINYGFVNVFCNPDESSNSPWNSDDDTEESEN
jgi:hypothetical protein